MRAATKAVRFPHLYRRPDGLHFTSPHCAPYQLFSSTHTPSYPGQRDREQTEINRPLLTTQDASPRWTPSWAHPSSTRACAFATFKVGGKDPEQHVAHNTTNADAPQPQAVVHHTCLHRTPLKSPP